MVAYLRMDLSKNSETYKSLFQELDVEASSEGSLVLTAAGDDGAAGAGLTSRMNAWLNAQVNPSRFAAINEVVSAASKIQHGQKRGAILEQVEIDRIDLKAAQKKASVIESFNNKHHASIEEKNELQEQYNQQRAEAGGLDAKVPSKFWEYSIILLLVMPLEGLINFESFRGAPWIKSDAMALGTTLLVGIFIAIAAYCFGLLVRQLHYFSRPADGKRRVKAWSMFGLGLLLLIAALLAVASARTYGILPRIEEALVLGQTPPNLVIAVASSLVLNVGCFLAAATFTFFTNDPDPDYCEVAQRLKKVTRKLEVATTATVVKPINEIQKQTHFDKEKVGLFLLALSTSPEYTTVSNQAAQIKEKDSEVIGVLQRYKSDLARIRQSNALTDPFKQRDIAAARFEQYRTISLNEFSNIPVRLLWGS
jgi:hypothetical protein